MSKSKVWKRKGRNPVRKEFQEYVRSKYKQGLVPNANGNWVSLSSIRADGTITSSYEALFERLGGNK